MKVTLLNFKCSIIGKIPGCHQHSACRLLGSARQHAGDGGEHLPHGLRVAAGPTTPGAAAGRPPAPPAAAHRGLPGRGRGRHPPEEPAAHQDLRGGPGDPPEFHPRRGPVPGRGGHPDSVRPAGPAQVHHHQVLSEPAVLSQASRQAEGQLRPRGGRGRIQRGGAAEGSGRECARQKRQHPLLGEARRRAGGGREHRPGRRLERLRTQSIIFIQHRHWYCLTP